MPYSIEVVSIGQDFYLEIQNAAETLNAVQKEFWFTIPTSRLKDEGLPFRRQRYHTKEVFDFLRSYRVRARGHRPFLIAVLNGPLQSDKLRNLFGSHEANEGLAIINLLDCTKYASSLRRYLCYYFIRYSLSFVAPQLRVHEETRSCFFDAKLYKPDLLKSLETGEFCDDCISKLQEHFNPETYAAIVQMIRALKSVQMQSPDSKKLVTPSEQEARDTSKKRIKVRAARTAARKPRGASVGNSPDFLILTAADIEYDTIANLTGIKRSLKQRRHSIAGRTFVDLGLRNCVAWALQCKKGSVGPGSSLDVVKDAISALKPFAIINTGIAFGLNPNKQDMGDVLVSEQLLLYEIERRGKTRLARGDKVSCSTMLLSWFRDCRTDWALSTPTGQRPRIHCGIVMSGEKLSDDDDFVSELRRIEPEAIGGEMEAAGVYAAASGEHVLHVHWIVVKAICDWGMGKGDKYQEVASKNAIDLVLHVLDQPVVASSLAHLKAQRNTRRRGGKS